jgi:hypothetical protein
MMANGALLNPYEQGALQEFNFVLLLYNFNALVARSFIPPFGSAAGLLVAYVLILLFIAAVLSGFIVKRKNLLAARALFLCVLVSMAPFITLGADTHDSESGRFVYLSSAFACMLMAELVTLLIGKRFQIATGFIILSIHAYFNFAKDYRYAGQAARQTLECLRDAGAKVYVAEVPSQYRGALIFRSGLPEAVQWYNDRKSNVNILSLKEIEHAERLTCEKIRAPGGQVEIIVIRVHP